MRLVTVTAALEDLWFDPSNPRIHTPEDSLTLPKENIGDPDIQLEILQKLAVDKEHSIFRLQVSIARNGLLPIDNIIVIRLDNGKYLVVEGNRRIAAIKLLLMGTYGNILNLSQEKIQHLTKIKVLVVDKEYPEENIMRFARLFQGLRHISGSRDEWNDFQKAWFTCMMKDSYDMGLSDISKIFSSEQRVVSRHYKSYKALMQMKDDSHFGQFAEAHLFAHFEEMLESTTIQQWLDWDNDELKFKNTTTLHTMYSLLAGAKKQNCTVQTLKSSKDVRSFSRILSKPKIVDNFLAGHITLQDALTLVGQPIHPKKLWFQRDGVH
ncbi:MAG: ParB N-terminal domain-containing protein [Clostridiales bacterium]|jgi:hypothetical protein|nr:ParB N-terminal domain-containing protein [Clostridiales bacterium]